MKRIILALAGLLLLTSCDKKIKELTDKLDNATKEVAKWRDESEKWRGSVGTIGEKVVEAADKVDPIALKELLRKNQTLEDKLKEIEALSRSSEGMLFLDSQELALRISRFQGNMSFKAEIERPNAQKPIMIADLALKYAPPTFPVLPRGAEEIRGEHLKCKRHAADR
jgi:hypothetical protein